MTALRIGRWLALTLARSYPLMIAAIVWETSARLGFVRPIFLPSLSVIAAKLLDLASSADLWMSLAVSLYRTIVGLAIALVVGVGVGFAMGRSRWIRWLVNPFVTAGFPAPKVAFLPVFLVWFGIDHLSKIALVAFTCVFPFIVAAQAGVASVPRVHIWAAQAMGTSQLQVLWRIVLPAALPSLMSGMRVAVPYALVTAFTAEMIAGGGGLGGDLVYAERYFETPTVFALLLVMLVVGYVVDHILLMLRGRVLRWQETGP